MLQNQIYVSSATPVYRRPRIPVLEIVAESKFKKCQKTDAEIMFSMQIQHKLVILEVSI